MHYLGNIWKTLQSLLATQVMFYTNERRCVAFGMNNHQWVIACTIQGHKDHPSPKTIIFHLPVSNGWPMHDFVHRRRHVTQGLFSYIRLPWTLKRYIPIHLSLFSTKSTTNLALLRFVASSVACYMAMSNSPEAGEDFVYTKRVVLVSLDVHSNPIHASTTTYITRAYQNSRPKERQLKESGILWSFSFLAHTPREWWYQVPLVFTYIPVHNIHYKSMTEFQAKGKAITGKWCFLPFSY